MSIKGRFSFKAGNGSGVVLQSSDRVDPHRDVPDGASLLLGTKAL